MANQSAWQSGFSLAADAIHARRQRKQALEDEERKLKVSELYDQGHKLAQLIPTLSGADRDQAMNQLTDVEQNIHEIYHPDNSPGAIQKDWNMLVDLITRKPRPQPLSSVQYDPTRTSDLTLPAQGGVAGGTPTTIPGTTVDVRPSASIMTPEQRTKMAQRDEARKQAALDVAAAGLSPEEEQQAKQQQDEASRAWQIDWAKRHGITGEALTELTQHIAGLPTRTKLKPLAGTKPYKGSDGRWYQSMENPDTGEIAATPMPEGYVPPPPTAGPVRGWTKVNGKPVSVLLDRQTNQPIAGTENTDLLPPPYLTQRLSQGFYYYTDEDNQLHQIPTAHASGPAPSGTPSTSGTVTGDRIIGTKGSAALNKARSSYVDAVKIANLADDVVRNSNSEKDALFVLALIRSEAGRVNQKEIDQIFQAGGISEAPERWAAKVGHDELPQELRLQLQDFTKAQVAAAQAGVDALRAPSHTSSQTGSGWTPPSGAPDASQFSEGFELFNKRTGTVDAVVRGGKWTKP
jgi:hypothetical protein